MDPRLAYAHLHALQQHFASGGPVQGPNQYGAIPNPGGVDPGPTNTQLAPADYGNPQSLNGGLFSGPVVTVPQLGTMQNNYTNLANGALGQNAPQVSYAGSNPWLSQQQQLSGQLAQQAAGNGPDPVAAQLQQNTQSNVANAYAMAQANPNSGGAARQAAEQAAQTNQAATGQAAQLRAQQQLNAQNAYGSFLNSNSQQALNVGINNAQFSQQQMAQNNSAAQGYLGQLQGYNLGQADAENKQTAATTQSNAATASAAGTLGSAIIAAARGAYVPGKAAVAGDSSKNDTVSAKLSPGEIVLPRSVVQSEDAPAKAAAFVKAIMAKKAKKAA